MRYKDTPGWDHLIGTSEDDVFTLGRGGQDSVNGGGGFDRVKVEHHGKSEGIYYNLTVFPEFEGKMYCNIVESSESEDGTYIDVVDVDRVSLTGTSGNDFTFVGFQTDELTRHTYNVDLGSGIDDLQIFFQSDLRAKTVNVTSPGSLQADFGTFIGFDNLYVLLTSHEDSASGGEEPDQFLGIGGADVLSGGGGADILTGGPQGDTLTGGSGADVFLYGSAKDTTAGDFDTIMDFSHADGDRIDLQTVDANGPGGGVERFVFIDQQAFTGTDTGSAELRQQANGDGTVTLQGDANHDKIADFVILVHTAAPLVAADILV